ncbi:hypothetical protein TNCT_433871 [Trichonephila clavata]|uniref:RNase H type-1 domain-containing protein n=1 Tax=Trichonephila clavata TaxID=2740835 RepID=A0A8X6GX55_TRICU|nr:hypothetical protein TNCT_433871 [Trichonephila clavata]
MEGLEIMSYNCGVGELRIFSDSSSALQHLSGWSSASDETSISVPLKLRKISQTYDVQLHNGYHYIITGEVMRSLIDWLKKVKQMKGLQAFL